MNPESVIMAVELSTLICLARSRAYPSSELEARKPYLIGSTWEVIYYQTKEGGSDYQTDNTGFNTESRSEAFSPSFEGNLPDVWQSIGTDAQQTVDAPVGGALNPWEGG